MEKPDSPDEYESDCSEERAGEKVQHFDSRKSAPLTNKMSGGNGLANVNLAGDSAYSAILKERLARFTIKNLNGDGDSAVNPRLGTFFNKDDS
jgi:hypothetical protein